MQRGGEQAAKRRQQPVRHRSHPPPQCREATALVIARRGGEAAQHGCGAVVNRALGWAAGQAQRAAQQLRAIEPRGNIGCADWRHWLEAQAEQPMRRHNGEELALLQLAGGVDGAAPLARRLERLGARRAARRRRAAHFARSNPLPVHPKVHRIGGQRCEHASCEMERNLGRGAV